MKSSSHVSHTKLSFCLLACLIALTSLSLFLPDISAAGGQAAKAKAKPAARSAKAKRTTTARARKQTRPTDAAQTDSIKNAFALTASPWEKFEPSSVKTEMPGEDENSREESEEEGKRADEPDKATQYYLEKRLPEGETELPLERYIQAQEEMKLMPLYSTADNRLYSRAELRGGVEQPKLGTWSSLGPGNIGGRTRAILINPQDPNIMYAASVTGGVWKSTNAGQSWTPVSDLIANVGVSSLAFEPGKPNVIYAGTGEGYEIGSSNGVNINGSYRGLGIYKSSDSGATWTRLPTTNTADFYYVNKLAVSTVSPQRVYAATSTGVWRSDDGGATWTRVHNPGTRGGCLDLAIRTDQQSDVVLAACGTLSQASVFRNPDAGGAGAWTSVLSDPGMGRTVIAFAPSNQNVAYALSTAFTGTFTNSLHALFRSTDGGQTWQARTRNTDANKLNRAILSNPPLATAIDCKLSTADSISGQGWYDLAMAIDPADENRVWAGGIDVARTDDGGANWGIAGFAYDYTSGSLIYGRPNQIHPDQHFITFHPQYNGTTNQQMFVGNDGGIWRTDNARAAVGTAPGSACNAATSAVRFTSLNNNYAVTQFYHGAVTPDGKTYFGGAQDNGTSLGTDAGGPNQWRQILLADGGYAAVDFLNPSTFYASSQGGNFRRSTDAGASFVSATLGLTLNSVLFITPLLLDPSDPLRIYVGGDIVNRSDNGMSNWTSAGSLRNVTGVTDTMSAIAVAPTDANQALFGMNSGNIVRTTRALSLNPANPLSTTLDRARQPRAGFVSWLAFDPNDRNIAYATYSTFGGAHVWRSTNAGDTWTSIDGTGTTGIPDIPVHCIVVDPVNTSRLYVGTDLGVFVSLDTGATWAVENTGFSNVVTESLVLNTAGGVTSLYAFTHGRGAFKVATGTNGCNFSLSRTGRSVAAAGSDLTVDVTVAPGGCNWTATSNVPWITVQPGAGGTANGTVGLKVAANTVIGRRTGTVAIAGRSFTVTQDGQPDLDSPTLRIVTPATPTVATTTGAISVAGTAGDNLRVAAVTWRSNRGLSGTATGTTNWTIPSLLLATGRNEITITAADEAGNVSSASVLVVTSTPSAVLATVVGTGTFGYNGENVPAVLANITNPSGTMFFDGGGNFYFADFNGARARRVSSAGLITSVAGNGSPGFSGDNGPASAAQLAQPRGVLADNNGNIYILDSGNQRIRRVAAATGIITTFAGTGATGFGGDGGPATSAQFDFGGLGAIALDGAGNLLVSDSSNNRIRRIAIDTGIITTIAGSTAGFSGDGGPAGAATLRSPQSLYFDKGGNLYVADNGNARIRRIAAGTGVITTVAGTGSTAFSGDGGPALNAGIGAVFGIAVDAGDNLYLSDVNTNRIRRVNASDGVINTIAGGGATGLTPDGVAAIGASFSLARHLGIDPQGALYIAEANNFRIRKLISGLANDTTPPTIAISDPATGGTFTATTAAIELRGTASDNGAVVSVRWSNDRGSSGQANGTNNWSAPGIGLQPGLNRLTVTAWDVSGNAASAQLAVTYAPEQVIFTVAGTGAADNTGDGGPGAAATLNQPRGVAVDSKGNIYIADTLNRRIRRVSPAGVISAFAGTGLIGSGGDGGPATEATLSFPNAVVVDKNDNVYISDQFASRVRKVTPDGKISTVAGNGNGDVIGFVGGFSGDGGPATQAQLNQQVGIAVDKDGNLFIADRLNHRIRRVDAGTGVITTVAGNGQAAFGGDGNAATQASLTAPTGVAVDGAGNLYIADSGNQRIRRVSVADGKISTIAGTGAAGFSGDGGQAANAQVNLAYPAMLSFDAAGDLYFADVNNHRIRKIALGSGVITTVAGTGLPGFNGDGTGPTGTTLAFPTSVAFDATGNLVIADASNHRIRRARLAAGLRTVSTVSAASFSMTAGLAAEEIAAIFGTNLASSMASATTLPLPITLAGTTVRVRDSLSVERLAPLFFVSVDQINYLVPSGTAAGIATVTVINGSGEVATGTVTISGVAPGLFSANATGTGVAAAVVFRRNAAGQDSYEPVARFDSATNRFVAVPIDLGPAGDQVFLIPFGTGFRAATGLSNVQATVGGVQAPAVFAGAVPGLLGADQVNLRLDRSLIGRGEVDVLLTVDGKTANPVRVTIK